MARLWFTDTDTGHGVPLLLLHPGGTDSRSLEPLIAELGVAKPAGYRVIVPEHRGHGRSADVDGEWHFEASPTTLLVCSTTSTSAMCTWSAGATAP